MADAGKLLIPEALRMGKDPRNYTEDDLNLLEEHFQNVSEQQPEFIIWEGPLEDPRYALAKSRKAPSLSSESQDQSETTDETDYRYESHSAKFRLVLPPGSKPPSGYVQVGTRRLPLCDIPSVHHPDSYLRLSSGLLVQELPPQILQDADWSFSGSEINSPIDSGILSPECMFSPNREFTPDYDDCKAENRESGLGSGADSVVFTNKISVSIQTDPLPPEFVHIQQGELKALEELRQKKEEEDRIAQESEALARREARRTSEDYDSAAMGETVMKYLKMVRRNSKSADMKKAERFRNMNYDPTLRNIRPKYVHNESTLNSTQHIGIQCGESLIKILKMCHTQVEPQRDKTKRRKVTESVVGVSSSSCLDSSPSPRVTRVSTPPATPSLSLTTPFPRRWREISSVSCTGATHQVSISKIISV